MHILTVSSRKGGVGKTTVSTLIAVEANRVGAGPVALVDCDPMRGLDLWWRARQDDSLIFVSLDGGLDAAVRTAKERGAKLLIIDTAPTDSRSGAGDAVAKADIVLIPIKPSPHDLRAVGSTVALCRQLKKPIAFVINMTKPRAKLTADAAVTLSQYGTVAPAFLGDRTVHAQAAVDGRTAPEIDPDGAAAVEAKLLWEYVAGRLLELDKQV